MVGRNIIYLKNYLPIKKMYKPLDGLKSESHSPNIIWTQIATQAISDRVRLFFLLFLLFMFIALLLNIYINIPGHRLPFAF